MSQLNAIASTYTRRFGTQGQLFRAPGRINLIGEHTDYNDGFVMPAAIDKEIVFAVGLSDAEQSTFYSYDQQESYQTQLDSISTVTEPAWANYLLGVVARLQQLGHELKPFNCVFGGNIPIGSGLSSSAALECGFIAALNELFSLNLGKWEMVKAAQWAEHNYAGVKCGIMDQFASMMGRPDQVMVLDCRSLEFNYYPLNLPGYELLLLDTRVKHSLASSEYNVRRAECEEGVKILQQFNKNIHSLRDASPADVIDHRESFSEKVYDRCLYVTQENERVLAAAHDLVANNLEAFGARMYDTHEGLSKLYEVSCKELDFLVDLAKEQPSVLGARMMGGGFGGCTINLIRIDDVEAFKTLAQEQYLSIFGVELGIYEVHTVEGASRAAQ